MGLPMAKNLLRKMGSGTRFYVYDVSKECMDQFVGLDEAKGRVEGCGSSREVADKSVRHRSLIHERRMLYIAMRMIRGINC